MEREKGKRNGSGTVVILGTVKHREEGLERKWRDILDVTRDPGHLFEKGELLGVELVSLSPFAEYDFDLTEWATIHAATVQLQR